MRLRVSTWRFAALGNCADKTKMRSVITCAVVLLASMTGSIATAQAPAPVPLQPGRFSYLPGTELGLAQNFENEVDSTLCHPLTVSASGQLIAWLSTVYALERRLLVRRCIEFDPDGDRPVGTKHGGEGESWEQVRLTPERNALSASRLRLPNWSPFASERFCSNFIAYWGVRTNTLIPIVYDLRTNMVMASHSIGRVELETDDRGYLAHPIWNQTCSMATFPGKGIKKPDSTLVILR